MNELYFKILKDARFNDYIDYDISDLRYYAFESDVFFRIDNSIFIDNNSSLPLLDFAYVLASNLRDLENEPFVSSIDFTDMAMVFSIQRINDNLIINTEDRKIIGQTKYIRFKELAFNFTMNAINSCESIASGILSNSNYLRLKEEILNNLIWASNCESE